MLNRFIFCKIKTAAALIARGSRRLNCQITCLVFLCFIAVAFVAIAFVAVAVVHGLVLSAAVTVLMDVSFAVAAVNEAVLEESDILLGSEDALHLGQEITLALTAVGTLALVFALATFAGCAVFAAGL